MPRETTEYHTFEDATCVFETKAALRVKVDGKLLWVPKSLVHDDSECYKKGTSGTLVLPLWWVEKEGLDL